MAKPFTIFGIEITDICQDDLVKKIIDGVDTYGKLKIYYVNVHSLNIAYCCPRFRSSLSSADIVFNDGFGVKIASALLRRRIKNRNTPPDWIDDLGKAASFNRRTFYFLGDEDYVVSKAAEVFGERHPELGKAGFHHGFFEINNRENDIIISKINAASPHILLVGMGMPKQEFWIDENIDRLKANVYIPVGALFRWYSSIDKRAPKWITDHGLEWLARLVWHPVKHFRRYVIGNPLFFIRLGKTILIKAGLPRTCNKPIFSNCFYKCPFFKIETYA